MRRLLLLSIFVMGLVGESLAALTKQELMSYLGDTCFRLRDDGTQLVNGQENPLASTLENFIALAEKFEAANPTFALKEELFYFIRNYTFDNLEYTLIGDITQWTPKEYSGQYIQKLWEPDDGRRERFPDAKDPFTDDEKCSLFFSISHSVVRSARKLNVERAAPNNTWRNGARAYNPELYYPMEQGVVSIRGSEYSTALGRVLTGLYVGLNENRKRPITDFPAVPPTLFSGMDNTVDPLYLLTVSEIVALATWTFEAKQRDKLAKDGRWESVPLGNDLDTREVCPMIYRLPDGTEQAFTYNSLRGAVDGLALGKVIGSIIKEKREVKLSQLLRMYYSKAGVMGQTDDIGPMWASFCNREATVNSLESAVEDQVRLYITLSSTSFKESSISSSANYAMQYYRDTKNEVFGKMEIDQRTKEISEYCRAELSIDRPEDLPVESKLDVIAIMDTTGAHEFFDRQQLILGHFARKMDLRLSGSQMTILTDQRLATALSTEGSVLLKPVVENTRSASCAACTVTQISFDKTGGAPEDEVIIALDQLLQRKKDNETRLSGVNGKVVLYFNFQEDEPTARPTALQSRVAQALRELHSRHLDVRIYALGRNLEVLKRYSRGDAAYALNVMDAAEKEIGDTLFKKISQAPSTLQFNDCEDGRGESSAVLEDFVTPNAIQHWEMPAKFFYKSRQYRLWFESQFGPIKVCYSRATQTPELQKDTCKDTKDDKVEFKNSNPCKGFTKESCAPFFFSIIGVNDTDSSSKRREVCSDSLNSDNKCRTLDQIKFKVMHEGLRCSGCLNLIASAAIIFIGVTFARLF